MKITSDASGSTSILLSNTWIQVLLLQKIMIPLQKLEKFFHSILEVEEMYIRKHTQIMYRLDSTTMATLCRTKLKINCTILNTIIIVISKENSKVAQAWLAVTDSLTKLLAQGWDI